MTITLTTLDSLREHMMTYRAGESRIALVPTMGALHKGHMALVEAAKQHADKVVVSIFVNPTQFGPNEDFSRYPRSLQEDEALLKQHGADAIWLPDVQTMYPDGFATTLHVEGVSEGLCGDFRPGHFDGVATVVAKLLLQVMPDVALFGQKDYQQLCVIRRMVQDMNMPIHIMGVPTVRETDGLAMSSRNRYLDIQQRKAAANIYKILSGAARDIKNGRAFNKIRPVAIKDLHESGFGSIEYFELRQNDNLLPPEDEAENTRLLIAAWIGTTRLIDNMEVK